MTISESTNILKNGLWTNNQALVALLGLCPLLAVTNNVVNAIGLGIATTVVLMSSNLIISLFRNNINSEVRLPIFVLLIASLVTVVELLMQSYFYSLYLILGIFVPLIVTNCAVLARAESYASKNTWGKSLLDGFSMGLGFSIVLILLGAMREIIGNGTLFNQMYLLFGSFDGFVISKNYKNILLAVLPPGGFIGLGLIVAFKNYLDSNN